MRNLKRALSLTLASVMLLGMMVVGSSAVSFPDVEDTHNVEAIDVLKTVKVMVGDDNGNFNPDDQVNRAQMAVVMALLLDLDYDYYKGTNPFWDVPSWAEPYVAACYANGIVSGYNATTYGSGDPVTAVQAASMMMRALGYFKYESDYKAGFELATVTQASKISLFKDVNAASNNSALTRNQVAQLALNTLESTVVDAKDNTLSINTGANAGNISITGGQVDYIVRTSTEPFATAFSDNVERGDTTTTGNTGYTVQLGEQLFNGDLKKDVTKYTPSVVDDFERPATRWTYKFSEIGTYADIPDYSYTKAASGDTPADKVKAMGLKGYKWDGVYYENGKTVSCGKTDAAALEYLADQVTADGVLIEVFMDDDNTDTIDTVTVIRTQMMQVSAVNTKEVTLKRLSDDSRDHEGASPIPMGTLNGFINVRVVKEDDEGFDVLKNLKVDDYVLIVPVEDGGSYKVASAVVPSSLTGVITNVYTKSGDRKIKAISVDNEKFNMSYAWTAEGDELRNDTTLSSKQESTVYFDTYGYVIYVKNVQASNDVIIIDEAYQGLVDGKLVTYVDGWNTNGDELTLNLGTAIDSTDIGDTGLNVDSIQGTVWEYATETANKAEYKLVAHGGALTVVDGNTKGTGLVYAPTQKQWIKNGQFVADVIASTNEYGTRLDANNNEFLPMATNVKFIFLSVDSVDGNDVTGITIREGVTAVGEDKNSNRTYDGGPTPTDKLKSISYILNKDMDKVMAVVVADDEDAAVTENLIFVKENNQHWIDKGGDNKTRTTFKAYDAQGNLIDNGESRLNMNVTDGSMNNRFFTYRQDANGVYSVSEYIRTDRITSVSSNGAGQQAVVTITDVDDKGYFNGVGGRLNARYATVIDLDTSDEVYTNSAADMAQAIDDNKATGFQVAYIFNGSDNVGAKTVSTLFVLKTITSPVSGGGSSGVEPGTELGDTTVSPNSLYITSTMLKSSTEAERREAITAAIQGSGYTLKKFGAFDTTSGKWTGSVDATKNGDEVTFTVEVALGWPVYLNGATEPSAIALDNGSKCVTSELSAKITGANGGYARYTTEAEPEDGGWLYDEKGDVDTLLKTTGISATTYVETGFVKVTEGGNVSYAPYGKAYTVDANSITSQGTGYTWKVGAGDETYQATTAALTIPEASVTDDITITTDKVKTVIAGDESFIAWNASATVPSKPADGKGTGAKVTIGTGDTATVEYKAYDDSTTAAGGKDITIELGYVSVVDIDLTGTNASTAFDVSGNAPGLAEANTTITVTLTAKSDLDLETNNNAAKVEAKGAKSIVCSQENVGTQSGTTDKTFTFVTTADATLSGGATLTITYEIGETNIADGALDISYTEKT